MIEQAFGRSPAWSVGVEEELMLLDERSHEPVAAASRLLAVGAEGVKAELFATVLETTTTICTEVREAAAQLVALRKRAADLAFREGLVIAAAGSHPFAKPESQPITDEPIYVDFVQGAGAAARRQGVQGLHVHVGMPDGETCVRAHENVLPWLPVVLAVSANSPWFRGVDSGFQSKRAEVLATLSRGGMPPPFSSYAEWEALFERWIAAGLIEKPTQSWWDARVHPALGTLELRAPDQPTEPAIAIALVALLHALAVWGAQADGPPASRADYQTNRFNAARFGPRAELVRGNSLVPVHELFQELVELVTPDPELIAPLRGTSCEAEWQLAAGDPAAACTEIVSRSLASSAGR
jgi:glutamate---cysteine ligase / carboxylate-amine ligase